MSEVTRAEPEHWRFGGGANDSVMHPLVWGAMAVTIIVILFLPKRFRLAAFLFSTFLLPAGQQILVGGLHLYAFRLIVLAGWISLGAALRRPGTNILGGGWNAVDRVFLLYVFFHVVAFILLNEGLAAAVNQIGYIWDYVGGYFLLRHLIQTDYDVKRTIRYFVYLVFLLALCMLREQATGQDIFGTLGGVRLFSQIREGRIRSQGVFQHAILAGAFAATVMPLFAILWKTGRAKGLAVIGALGAGVMVVTSACSTPIVACGTAILGIAFWPIRRYLSLLRWAVVVSLVSLHLTMEAPVWALIQRLDIVQGASSYHRYQLVDQFIRHWDEWLWTGTTSNAGWGDFTFDVANQYVAEGTGGGFCALFCFILLITTCFRLIGRTRRAVEGVDRRNAWLVWSLGVALFTHVIGFLGISYFDQTRVAWFALLAMICAATAAVPAAPAAPECPLRGETLQLVGVSQEP